MERIIKISQLKYIKIIMESFLTLSLITIVGSMMTLIISLPLGSGYEQMLDTLGLKAILTGLLMITSDCYSIYLVFILAVRTAQSFNISEYECGFISLAAFFLILSPADGSRTGFVIPEGAGAEGICLAILTGIISARFYCFLHERLKIKRWLQTMLSAVLIWGAALLTATAFRHTGFGTVQGLIYTFLQLPLLYFGGGFKGIFIATLYRRDSRRGILSQS